MKKFFPYLFSFFLPALASNAQRWLPQGEGLLPFGYEVTDISVVHDSVIWVSASLPNGIFHPVKIFRSVDAGNHWQTIDLRLCENCRCKEIEARDEHTAWISTEANFGDGRLYKTTDGGQTWNVILSMSAAGQGIELYDDQHIACRNGYRFAWSEDGGEQWMSGMLTGIPSGFYPVSSSSGVHGDTAWFGMEGDQWYSYQTTNAKLIRTTHNGSEYSLIDVGLDSIAAIDMVSFADAQHGIMKYLKWVPTLDWDLFPAFTWSDRPYLALTKDGGTTWTPLTAPFTQFGSVSTIPGLSRNLFAANENIVFQSFDSGVTWSQEILDGPHCCFDFSNAEAGWLAIKTSNGQTPLVYKWNGDQISATGQISGKLKMIISVYPNPSNSIIHYKTEGGEIGTHKAILTDAANQTILHQYSDRQELDIGFLPAGIYYLRLSTTSGTGVVKVVKY
jgi:hypothetical protein